MCALKKVRLLLSYLYMENQTLQTQNNSDLSKREKYELRKGEREKESSQTRRDRIVKKTLTWLVVLGGLGVLVWVLAQYGGGNSTTDGALSVPVSESDWFKGGKEAKVVLVEYGDFQCPACASYYPLVKQLSGEFGDSLKVVYRHFPLSRIHQHADSTARASEAAGRQGKFWEMHDLIFGGQTTWSNYTNAKARDTFISYAQSLGLNIDQFKNDMDLDEVKDSIKADFDGGSNSGVNSTPSFFLNGQKIKNPQSYEEFKTVIQDALNK